MGVRSTDLTLLLRRGTLLGLMAAMIASMLLWGMIAVIFLVTGINSSNEGVSFYAVARSTAMLPRSFRYFLVLSLGLQMHMSCTDYGLDTGSRELLAWLPA